MIIALRGREVSSWKWVLKCEFSKARFQKLGLKSDLLKVSSLDQQLLAGKKFTVQKQDEGMQDKKIQKTSWAWGLKWNCLGYLIDIEMLISDLSRSDLMGKLYKNIYF
jgi:hypothetical protein